MAVVWALARSGLRRRRSGLVGLAVVLALGLGVSMASLDAARRTQHAYPSYLRRAGVGELVVNPSLNTDRAEDIVASTPGVVRVTSDALLTATIDSGEPRTQAEIDSTGAQVLLSTDGRYVTQDRPAVREGRMIAGGREAFLNAELADDLRVHVGDMVPLAFWPTDYGANGGGGEEGPDPLVEPFARTEVRVVGIGVFADEVLVDGLYSRQRVLVSPEVGEPFDCRIAQPARDDSRSVDELGAELIRPGCSTSYRYFSIRVEGGDAGVGRLTDALAVRFAKESEQLPAALRAAGIGYEVTPTVTADERQRVQRSLQPAVRALELFGFAAAVSTLVISLLGSLRTARREERDAAIWRDLGAGGAVRASAIALPLGAAAAVGLGGSVVVAWLASGLGPVASARSIEPGGRLGLSAFPVLAVVGASSLVLVAGAGLAAAVVAGSRSRRRPPAVAPSRLLRQVTSPSLKLGTRAAVGGAGGRALLAASVAAVSVVLATVVFSASLGGLVSHPDRFGWPYDVAATVNYGYGGSTDPAAVEATLDRPDVEHWALASISGTLRIGDATVPFVAGRPGFDTMPLPVVSGALPTAGDEIALGTLTAKRLGIGVGDTTVVKTLYGEREATVRGLVVLPPLGPFLADRTSLGSGVLLSEPLFTGLLADAEKEAGVPPGQFAGAIPGFVAVDLRDGVDPGRFLASIAEQLPTWDLSGAAPFTYAKPVRPATVANVAAMRAVPVLLAGLLALTMAIGLALAVAVAVRARRRELALLRALGCVGRQLRATVRWQALTVAGVGLVVGIPLGVAAGRTAYGAFARGLGIRPDAVVSLRWMLVVVVATIAMGLLAAAGPGYQAARVTAGEALRKE